MAEEKNSAAGADKRYTNEIINKIFTLAYYIEYFENPENTVKKWGRDIDFLQDEELIKAAAAAGKEVEPEHVKKALSGKYNARPCKYKEAMRIIDGLDLKNKDIAQIIALYYFVNEDISPLENKPFSADEKEDISYLAGLVDALYSTVRQNGQPPKRNTTENSPELDKFLSDLSIFGVFLQIFLDDAEKPNIPNGATVIVDFTENVPITPEDVPAAKTEPAAAAGPIGQPQQLELPLLLPIAPKYYIMPNNALINDIEKKERINYGPYDLDVFEKKSDITSYIQITYEPDPDSGITIKGQDRLTAYERTVSNAIVSLWDAAQKEGQDRPIISPGMIYRAMPGGGEKLGTGQKSAIVKAIKKLQSLRIYIDATDEMRKRKVIGPKESFTLDSNYLLTTHVQYRAPNGYPVHAYRIEAEPIILTYSKAANQLLTIPAKYLDIRQVKAGKITDKPIRMSGDRQAVADYLLRRIAIMKRDVQNKKQKQSRYILFDTIYKTAGQEEKPRDQKKELRNFCIDVLEYQTAAGNIKGYKKLKEGREIAKIEILL